MVRSNAELGRKMRGVAAKMATLKGRRSKEWAIVSMTVDGIESHVRVYRIEIRAGDSPWVRLAGWYSAAEAKSQIATLKQMVAGSSRIADRTPRRRKR